MEPRCHAEMCAPGCGCGSRSEKTRSLSLAFSAAQGGKIGQVGGGGGSPKLGEVTPNLKAADRGLLPNCLGANRAQTGARGKRGAFWAFAEMRLAREVHSKLLFAHPLKKGSWGSPARPEGIFPPRWVPKRGGGARSIIPTRDPARSPLTCPRRLGEPLDRSRRAPLEKFANFFAVVPGLAARGRRQGERQQEEAAQAPPAHHPRESFASAAPRELRGIPELRPRSARPPRAASATGDQAAGGWWQLPGGAGVSCRDLSGTPASRTPRLKTEASWG